MQLQRPQVTRAVGMLLFNWGLIVGCFALVILLPGPVSVLLAILVLGGRQLGLGILMHECAHRSFLPSRQAGEWVGTWLFAAPIYADLAVYRSYHMTHHLKTGTDGDPDVANYAGYPVSAASFARKMVRDVFGLSGLRAMLTLGVLYSHKDPSRLRIGYAHRSRDASAASDAAEETNPRGLRYLLWNTRRIAVVHGAAFGLLWALGHPLAYLLWPAAWLTSYMIYSRIRNAAEHGGLRGTMSPDPFANTRTVIARWWERLTVAPNFVNYHFEHHLAPTVPSYRLPELHRYLAKQGALARFPVQQGYVRVIRELIRSE